MKILHFIPTFGPGGAERQLALLAAETARRSHECCVGYLLPGPNLRILDTSGARAHQFSHAGNHNPLLLIHAHRLALDWQPDIIQTWLPQMDVIGGLVARHLNIPWIVSERSSAGNYAPGWKTSLRTALTRRAQHVIANSTGGMDYWQAHATQVSRTLIRNGLQITPANSSSAAQQSDLLAKGRTLLFAGRFSYEKNLTVLVKALMLLLPAHSDVNAVMFGEGPEREPLRAFVRSEGFSDRISMPGFSDSLASHMRQATACVSVSNHEGNPNVVLEAAALGCPLVLSDIPAHREVLDDRCAIFTPPSSAEAIAVALNSLLIDPAAARRRSAAAAQAVSGYSTQRLVEQHFEVYAGLVRDRKRVA